MTTRQRSGRIVGARRAFGARRLGLALAAAAMVFGGLTLVASSTPATDGNPDLTSVCGLKVSLILDDSASIDSTEADQARTAADTFATALVGTPSSLKVDTFDTRAKGVDASGHLTSNLDDVVFRDPSLYTAPTSGAGQGGTNWDDGLETIRRSSGGPGDLVVFITDGDPTYRNTTTPDGHANDGTTAISGDGSNVSSTNLANAVTEADAIKAAGAHMFGIGVGLSASASKQRLNDVTGDDELTLDASGAPNIPFGEADFTIAPKFSDLQKVVKAFVRDLCAPSVNVTKYLQRADGSTVKADASTPWTFGATVSPAPLSWQTPAGASGASASATSDASGGVSLKWKMDANSASANLSETAQPGWVYNGARCTRNLLDGQDPTVIFDSVGTNAANQSGDSSELQALRVGINEAVNCDVYNRQIRPATIQVTKKTVPAGLPDTFDFTLHSGPSTAGTVAGIGDGQTGTFAPVPAGTYSVTEAAHAGYTQTSATCDDLATEAVEQADPSELTVGEGGSWKCTFTNTAQPGTVTVVKDTVGAEGTFHFTSNVPDLGDFDLTTAEHTASTSTITVPVGTYSVDEGPAAPWTLTGSTCTGQQAPSSFTVAPGADVVCTFTNTAPAPTITVTKSAGVATVAEPGGPVTYTVGVTNTSVEPLTVSSVSDVIDGGSAIDLTSTGGPVTATTCDALVGATLATSGPGATKTCTFTADVAGAGGSAVSDTATVVAKDADGASATDSADASVGITRVPPSLAVTKSASVSSIAEPGGDITYTVGIKNTGVNTVVLDSLSDVTEGGSALDITAVAPPISATTCGPLVGTSLAAGASTSCTFTVAQVVDASTLPDGTLDDTVTVAGHSGDAKVSAHADASVAVIDTLPTITVTKTATPTTVAETAPGQTRSVSYLVTVQNTSVESVSIDSVTDSVEGAPGVAAGGSCAALVGTVLAPQAGTSCTFTLDVSGNAADVVHDVATVNASDDDDNSVSAHDAAAVTFTDLASSIEVTKTATPGSVAEPGGPVSYTVTAKNTSAADSITIGAITDSVSGGTAFAAGGTCPSLIGTTLAPGDSATCSFTLTVAGNAGDAVPDTVTVAATDDDGGSLSGTGAERVTITDLPSSLAVTKTPSVSSVPEPGGPVTYTVGVTNTSAADTVTLGSLTDSVSGGTPFAATGDCPSRIGTTLAPGASTSCSFTLTVAGNAGDVVPDTVVVGGTDDDGGAVSAQASAVVDVTDVASSLSITKTPSVSSVPEPGGPVTYTVDLHNTSPADPVTFTSIVDSVSGGAAVAPGGTCDALVGTTLAAGASATCQFTMTVSGNGGDVVPDTVTVSGHDDDIQPDAFHTLTASASAVVDVTNVLPAGTVTKTPTPSTVPEPGGPVSFGVVVTNTSTETESVTALTDTYGGSTFDVTAVAGKVTATTCATGASLAPGATYSCAFTLVVSGNAGAVASDHLEATLTDRHQQSVTPTDDATVSVTDVLPTITVSKDNSDASVAAPGGDVDFHVGVANTSVEPVTLNTLTDTIEGGTPFSITTVAGAVTATDCATGGSIAVGATYTCTFTLHVASDEAITQADVVNASAVDDEGNPATAGDSAVTAVTASADLAIHKELVDGPLVEGKPGQYLLTVTNHGPSTAVQPVVIDTLPDGITATGASGDGWACAIDGRKITCQRSSLASGASSTITVAVQVAPATAGEDLLNQADVSATTPDPDPSNNHDEVLSQPVAVQPSDTTPPPATTTPGTTTQPTAVNDVTLPRTGSDPRAPMTLGVLLLVSGGFILVARRGRRRLHRA